MFDSQKPHDEVEREPLPADLASLERQLKAFIPGVPRIVRDQLMFDAGRASAKTAFDSGVVRYSDRFWRVATFVSTAASIALAVLLVQQSRSTDGNVPVAPQFAAKQPEWSNDLRFASIPQPVPEQPGFWTAWIMPLPSTSGYIAKRDAVLTYGPSAIEIESSRLTANSGASSVPSPVTVRDLMEEFLPGSTQELDTSVLLL